MPTSNALLASQALAAIFDKDATITGTPTPADEVKVTVAEIDPTQFLALAQVAIYLASYPFILRSGAAVTVKFYC